MEGELTIYSRLRQTSISKEAIKISPLINLFFLQFVKRHLANSELFAVIKYEMSINDQP